MKFKHIKVGEHFKFLEHASCYIKHSQKCALRTSHRSRGIGQVFEVGSFDAIAAVQRIAPNNVSLDKILIWIKNEV